jgi:hypothetical protein
MISKEILISRLEDLIDNIEISDQTEFDTGEVEDLFTEARLFFD